MRILSSDLTFINKFVFPSFWIGGFFIGTLFMFISPEAFDGGDDVYEVRWAFLIATCVGSVFFYWSCIRLKKVSLNGEILLISNFRKTLEMPLSSVERVSGSFLITPELIWLHFRAPTEFGSKIIFMPKYRFFGGFTQHPLVKELKRLSEKASLGMQVSP